MFKNPFSFKGRIRRTEYGLSYILFLFSLYTSAFLITELELGSFNVLIIFAAMYWFQFSQGTRRCHDLGNNGFYQIIPFYVFVLLFSEGQNRKNKYGQDPKLVELQEKDELLSPKPNWRTLPQEKTLEVIGSELLSGVLLTTLAVVIASNFMDTTGVVYYILETILVMTGYFTLLYISFKWNPLPQLPWYFLIHRAVFSVLWYVFFSMYEVYFNNITDINFAAIGGDIIYVISAFIATYIPYLIFKQIKTPKLIQIDN